ncbi:MAG: DciA family protein [Slackia sp.]|nr:DciA family protein [Slackia sp.]
MGSMKSFSSALQKTLRASAASSELAAKAARANKVKQMWRDVVDGIFLDHTNAVYIVNEREERVLIVYVDDSLFAAELNARRELIKLKLLERHNEQIDDFRILVSRGKYKKNYPFRCEPGASLREKRRRVELPPEKRAELELQCRAIEDERLRAALLKAMISDLEWKSESEDEKYENQAL